MPRGRGLSEFPKLPKLLAIAARATEPWVDVGAFRDERAVRRATSATT